MRRDELPRRERTERRITSIAKHPGYEDARLAFGVGDPGQNNGPGMNFLPVGN